MAGRFPFAPSHEGIDNPDNGINKGVFMNAAELRSHYLEFFAGREHRLLPSSPLVPNDPTLLFTSAGMVQFKDILWGRTMPTHPRATTCQKCFRTVDIENVGKTAHHLTFFEMLGNFSFGDYFKEGAIGLAWEFLTRELGLTEERLTAAVYEEDDEAYAVWRDVIGLPPERIVRLGREHNWWGPVGNSGPCGPDSEIHYDTGEAYACGPDCRGAACDCDRYSEIWNLVFMEYEAQEDGTLIPLKRKNIDTGMGLERTVAVLRGLDSVFEVDSLRPIVEAIEAASPHPLSAEGVAHRNTIADHVRAAVFLLADGVMPGNERQGYVLRRVLRRAIRAGERLELAPGSLATFVEPVIGTLGEVYPEIAGVRDLAGRLIDREEETFRRTLRDGERRLEKLLEELVKSGETVLPGELAFELTDTYGFPLEMTQEIAAERGAGVDLPGFESALEEQRERSRIQVSADVSLNAATDAIPAGAKPTKFLGYATLEAESTVESVLGADGTVARLVFPESPFYAEAGGQTADTGRIENLDQEGRAIVAHVTRDPRGVYLHVVSDVEGTFQIGDRSRLIVDADRRRRIQRNHTATHLLHAALRRVLGPHVKQAGSFVNDAELRFDFSHFERLTPGEITRVEDFANAAVLADHPVRIDEVTLERAQEAGAIGLFEEEYRGKDKVRVVRVDDVSEELCGGTHVSRTGEIGLIKVVSEESIASGVRRVRAITGDAVLARLREQETLIRRVRDAAGETPIEGIERLKAEIKCLEKRLEAASNAQARHRADELFSQAEAIGEVRLISGQVDTAVDQLKTMADLLEEQGRPAVVILVGRSQDRGVAVCKISKRVQRADAGAFMRMMSEVLGGGGGGSRTFAQGGGPSADRVSEALEAGKAAARASLA